MPAAQRRESTGRDYLRLLCGHPAHLFRVQLHRIITQFGFSCRFQVVTPHREVTVSLHPPGQRDENADLSRGTTLDLNCNGDLTEDSQEVGECPSAVE